MTAPGRACTPCRQAFFLLSDVIGLSRVVNLMHDAKGRKRRFRTLVASA
jgi:hypothetical protein